MKTLHNFTPGPSQLYFTVEDHIRTALREGIPSLSHRSTHFEKIFIETAAGIKTLVGIPADWHVLFTASATEIWERTIQNLVESDSHHLVNGAFSRRFYETAVQLNRTAGISEANDGQGFQSVQFNPATELIALTHNETSTGVSLPGSFINSIREANAGALLVVDAVSSLPYPLFDYTKIDSVFFSVQKGFGLPAGLGVWIVNDNCLAKAESMDSKGFSIGSYHSLLSLVAHAKKHQTPETPNVLGIYLLGKVVHDMLRRGIDTIRRETEYKAAILYQALDQHRVVQPFVQEKEFRSQTVIVADTGNQTQALAAFLKKNGLQPGEGYGKHKTSQLRFANFPAHSKELFELLVDTLGDFGG